MNSLNHFVIHQLDCHHERPAIIKILNWKKISQNANKEQRGGSRKGQTTWVWKDNLEKGGGFYSRTPFSQSFKRARVNIEEWRRKVGNWIQKRNQRRKKHVQLASRWSGGWLITVLFFEIGRITNHKIPRVRGYALNSLVLWLFLTRKRGWWVTKEATEKRCEMEKYERRSDSDALFHSFRMLQ